MYIPSRSVTPDATFATNLSFPAVPSIYDANDDMLTTYESDRKETAVYLNGSGALFFTVAPERVGVWFAIN